MSVEHEPKYNKETLLGPTSKEIDQLAKELDKELEAKAEASKNGNNVEQISQKVELLAISGKEMSPAEKADTRHHPVLINKQLKDMAYSRTMTRIRKHLSLPSRVFSKAIHSNVIDKPSEIIGNTVARPSGLLGGAFIAAIGSTILLWLTKHFGYTYNYLVVVLLFVLGLVFGLTVEALWRLVRRNK